MAVSVWTPLADPQRLLYDVVQRASHGAGLLSAGVRAGHRYPEIQYRPAGTVIVAVL
jgi:hypothetical protein